MTITALTALFALLNLLFLIFYKIMDTFVHIVYSSLEFLKFFLILINLLIDLFFKKFILVSPLSGYTPLLQF